jgi:hypothetical protein
MLGSVLGEAPLPNLRIKKMKWLEDEVEAVGVG